MDNHRPERRNPIADATINLRSGLAIVVAAALGALAGALVAGFYAAWFGTR